MTNAQIKPVKGDNIRDKIKQWAEEYADCDAESQKLNERRADIRQEVEDHGQDKAAFVEEVNLAKKSLKRKEGYKESKKLMNEVIGGMNQLDLWSHIVEKEEAKKKEREEAKAAKKKETGKEQADAYLKAHNE